MRKTWMKLLVIILIIAMLSGCQATPDEEIVVQKDMEQMIEKAQQTDEAVQETAGVMLREQTGAPETLKLETTEGNFTLSVDAEVSVPDAYSMPIIKVKAGEFSQEMVTEFWDTLVGDVELYTRSSEQTKSEIQTTIVYLQKFIEEYKNNPDYEESVEETKEQIEELEAKYNSAPEEIEIIKSSSTLSTIQDNSNEGTYIYEFAGGDTEGHTMGFSAMNRTRDSTGEIVNDARMTFFTADANYNYGQVNTITVDESTDLDESLKAFIQTTPAEAKVLAEEFIQNMGIPMEIYCMSLVNDEETGIYDGVVAPAEHYAYSIICKRVVDDDLPTAFILGSTYVEDEEDLDYIREWNYETLSVMINDSGIIGMEWYAPLEILETKVEDCTLLPFSDIQSTFEKMMSITFQSQSEGMENLTCSINEVHLEMMRVVEQGSVENGLLIPVWNFYGVRSRTYNGETDETSKYILLCINAVDGSVIDISKGY